MIGGGFAGSYVARRLAKTGATIVNPTNFMLYTPLLPEAASGAVEPRRVVVPIRTMCPHAELIVGFVSELDVDNRVARIRTETGVIDLTFDEVVIALGALSRVPDVPGLREHALQFKDLADAITLRNHVLHQLELADADLENAERRLTFAFVGAGYAGVEALAEAHDLVRESLRHYPRLRDVPQRWLLVDGGDRVLAQAPAAARRLRGARPRQARHRDPPRHDGWSRSTSRAPPSPTARASRPRAWCGRPASRPTRSCASSACRSTTAAACWSTSTCA